MAETDFDFLSCIRTVLSAYGLHCQSLCKELQIPQTAFDILMFLANNPDLSTARDITEIRGIKPNLVSVNVDKLVQAGYLERAPMPGDRRKILLRPTPLAQPLIDRGSQMQHDFSEQLLVGIPPEMVLNCRLTFSAIRQNASKILK